MCGSSEGHTVRALLPLCRSLLDRHCFFLPLLVLSLLILEVHWLSSSPEEGLFKRLNVFLEAGADRCLEAVDEVALQEGDGTPLRRAILWVHFL